VIHVGYVEYKTVMQFITIYFEVLIEVLNDEVDLNKDMDVAQAIGS